MRHESPTCPDADRVLISVNPKAGARSEPARVEQLVDLLEQRGFRVSVLTDLDEIAQSANQWHADGSLRTLVGVGGDGTAAELVNRTTAGLPITLFPAGNENLLARRLQLSKSPQSCFETIVARRIVRLDAGRAGGRIFLLMASCGFDAEVVRRVHAQRTGHIGRLTYLKPILDSIRSYEYPEIRVYWTDEPSGGVPADASPLRVRWLFAFNLPCYGGGLRIAPEADGTDGLLDVCTLREGGLWPGLGYAAAILLGWHRRLADFAVRRAARLRIESDGPVPCQLDGDPGGMLPMDIEVLPQRLTLLAP